jgi:predicted nucleic-acid-binding protein
MKIDRVFADTNLFLRYLTDDIPEQAEAVEQLLRDAEEGRVKLVTSLLVIAEIVWTLESYYKLSKEEIQRKVLATLNTPGLEVENSEVILPAILWYAEKNIDFIDAYNAAWCIQRGVISAYTFDRKHFSRIEGLTPIVPGEQRA